MITWPGEGSRSTGNRKQFPSHFPIYFFWGVTVGSVQELLLVRTQGSLLVSLGALYRILEMESQLVMFKASYLPAVISLKYPLSIS